eukprot:2406395-Pyramimonas_sp.AAC.1
MHNMWRDILFQSAGAEARAGVDGSGAVRWRQEQERSGDQARDYGVSVARFWLGGFPVHLRARHC